MEEENKFDIKKIEIDNILNKSKMSDEVEQSILENAIDNSISKMVKNGKMVKIQEYEDGELKTRYIRKV